MRLFDFRRKDLGRPSPWKLNRDGTVMGDEDGKAVTEAFYEMQRPVAERAFAVYQETGSWLQAGLQFGEGPAWAEAICRRYELTDPPLPEAPEAKAPGKLSRPSGLAERLTRSSD